MTETTPATAILDTPGDQVPARSKPVMRLRRRRFRPLRMLFGFVITIVLVVLLLLGLVLGTQTGLRTAIKVAEELAPGVIAVEQADGRVLGRLHLAGVAVRVSGLDLDLGSFDLDWSPLGLVAGSLRISEIAVRDIDVVAAPGDKEDEPEVKASGPIELPRIDLPIEIILDRLLVERLSVSRPGAETSAFRLDRAFLSATLQGSELRLLEISVDLPEPALHARAEGQAELVDRYPLKLGLKWNLALPPGAVLSGDGRVSGDLQRLTIEHDLNGAAEVALEAHVQALLEAPAWDGVLEINAVDVPAFAADAPRVDMKGRLETNGNLQEATVRGKISGTAPDLPDFGQLQTSLDVIWQGQVLTIRALELTEDKSGALVTAEGTVDLNPTPGALRIAGAWEKLRWPLTGDVVAESRQGKLDLSGTFEAFDYAIETEAQGAALPTAALTLSGTGDQQSTRITALKVDTLGGRIEAGGDVAWAPSLNWDLSLTATDINPGDFKEGMDDRIGMKLVSTGDLDAFQYAVTADTAGPALPPSKLAVKGSGNLTGTDLESLRLDALDGVVEAKGKVRWEGAPSWDVQLGVQGIDPGSHWPEWPGKLGGSVVSSGEITAEGPVLTATVEDFSGTMRGYPVAVSGSVDVKGKEVAVNEFVASSGPSKARVSGHVGEQLDLAFDVVSPDLASLLPEARGSIQATGQVVGTVEAPEIRAELAARNAQMAGQGIARLDGKVEVGLGAEGRINIKLDGADLMAGGMVWDTLRVRGDGSMADHRLTAAVTGDVLSAEVSASGSLGEGNAYSGQLATLALLTKKFGQWRLQKPSPVEFAAPKISAGPLCIRDASGSGGCVSFTQTDAGKWSAEADLDRLGFELLSAFLPQDMLAEGAARATARFQAADGQLKGAANLAIRDGKIKLAMATDRFEMLDFSGTDLKLNAGAAGLDAGLALRLAGLGAVNGDVSLPGWRLDAPSRPGQALKGRVTANINDLTRIGNMLPDVTDITGNVDVDLGIGGTIAKPAINGHAKVVNAGAQVPLIGLVVQGLNLNALASSGNRIDYQGEADIGGGKFELIGDTRQQPNGFYTQVRASGKDLKMADTKEYFALVSPEIEARIGPAETTVKGKVVIPEARIRPRAIPAGAVSPSSDVVDMGEVQEKPRSNLVLDMNLVLGDKVTIDAFGVKGRLVGDLRVFNRPGRTQILGDGQLGIVDGTYRMSTIGISAAIGQALTIEQGRLIYAKSPIDNPGLLLQAQREGGDVTAGIRVLGTIKRPKMAFFSDSDPDMNQSDIINYLVTGNPPKKDSDSSRSLSVGTYVAPKLFMEYESSLGDEADKIKLRYDLTKSIELQTETGDSQGADIFYKFER